MNRIREQRTNLHLTQSELAQRVGVSRSTIAMWETGGSQPDNDALRVMADAMGVSTDYLLGRTDQPRPAVDWDAAGILQLPDTVPVPLVGDIACGTPILAEQNIEDYLQVPSYVHASFCLRCHGDSMINARIFDGDLVFIRKQDAVDDGEIAAVLIGDEATLKRVRKLPGKLVLSPCNPMYDDMIYQGAELDDVRILGKAVYFISAIR